MSWRCWYLKGADNTPYEKIGDEVRSLADEVPFDIPDSWEWVRIRSLGEIVRGSGIKRNETVQQGLPCVRYGELYVPQRRPTQDDRQDHRSHAGYGRGYVGAGPADPFQAETYDGF